MDDDERIASVTVYQSHRGELCRGAVLPTNGWAIVWDAPSFDAARAELWGLIAANSWVYVLKKTLPEAVWTARYLIIPGQTHKPKVFWVGVRP